MLTASNGGGNGLGTHSSGPFTPIARQTSIDSLLRDELPNTFGSMNMKLELLQTMWTPEESHAIASAVPSANESNSAQQCSGGVSEVFAHRSSLPHPQDRGGISEVFAHRSSLPHLQDRGGISEVFAHRSSLPHLQDRGGISEVFVHRSSLPHLQDRGGISEVFAHRSSLLHLQDLTAQPMVPSGKRPMRAESLKSSDGPLVIVDSAESPEVVQSLGRRLDGPNRKRKRLRDEVPKDGKICHNCRQRSTGYLTCSTCISRLCVRCLLNRHGEEIELERAENVRWVCPKCRGGCGAGCIKNCCNCGPCRKAQNLEPTGKITRTAHSHGFTNVHDYLIHLATGESPVAIAQRKQGRGWTATDTDIVALVTDQHKTSPAGVSVFSPSASSAAQSTRDPKSTWEIPPKRKRKSPKTKTVDHKFRHDQTEKGPGFQRYGEAFMHMENTHADFEQMFDYSRQILDSLLDK